MIKIVENLVEKVEARYKVLESVDPNHELLEFFCYQEGTSEFIHDVTRLREYRERFKGDFDEALESYLCSVDQAINDLKDNPQ